MRHYDSWNDFSRILNLHLKNGSPKGAGVTRSVVLLDFLSAFHEYSNHIDE